MNSLFAFLLSPCAFWNGCEGGVTCLSMIAMSRRTFCTNALRLTSLRRICGLLHFYLFLLRFLLPLAFSWLLILSYSWKLLLYWLMVLSLISLYYIWSYFSFLLGHTILAYTLTGSRRTGPQTSSQNQRQRQETKLQLQSLLLPNCHLRRMRWNVLKAPLEQSWS